MENCLLAAVPCTYRLMNSFVDDNLLYSHAMACAGGSHIPNTLNQGMILGIRRLLVQNLDRLSVKIHEFSLESDPVDPSHIIPKIVGYE